MRRASPIAALAALALAVAPATAKPAVPRNRPSVDASLWVQIVEPHKVAIQDLLDKARSALNIATEAVQADGDWSVPEHMRYYEDIYYLMRFARTLAPDNTEVTMLFARAAVEIGKTREAKAALEHALRVAGPDKVAPEIVGELGAIQLRSGDRDAAIRTLQLAQGTISAARAPALFHLANALAAGGDISGAVDVLASAMPPTPSYYSADVTLLVFTLGVIYDRDEQRHAAFEVLERLRSATGVSMVRQVQDALQMIRFAPAEDQHYYFGLLYEINQQYVEARAAFAAYAAIGDSPWRQRALEHVKAIDAQRRTPPAKPATATKTPPPKP